MRTEKIKLFQFEELSEAAKNKAIERNFDALISFEWWESIFEDAENIGLKITGFDIDRGAYVSAEYYTGGPFTANAIKENHGKTCETYELAEEFIKERAKIIDTAERDEDGYFLDESALNEDLEFLESEFLNDLQNEYLSMLRTEYEYLTSEEAISEHLIINKYEFKEDGAPW